MAEKFVNLLKKLFDYQKFEQNESLNCEIEGVHERAKNYVLEDSHLAAVVGGVNKSPDGLKCPRCDALIPVSMEQVIESKSLICPHCGLVLNIDPVKENK